MPILKAARARAPVRQRGTIKGLSETKGRLPGYLRASIRRAVKKEPDANGSMTVGVGASRAAFYWMFQEFGTRHQPARPFLRPAFDAQAPTALGIVGRKLGEGIEREAAILSGRIKGPVRRRRR